VDAYQDANDLQNHERVGLDRFEEGLHSGIIMALLTRRNFH